MQIDSVLSFVPTAHEGQIQSLKVLGYKSKRNVHLLILKLVAIAVTVKIANETLAVKDFFLSFRSDTI